MFEKILAFKLTAFDADLSEGSANVFAELISINRKVALTTLEDESRKATLDPKQLGRPYTNQQANRNPLKRMQ